jgi:SOS-response transcriptional repressor LexA
MKSAVVRAGSIAFGTRQRSRVVVNKVLGETSLRVLLYVVEYVTRERVAPSYREIMAGCDLKSTSGVTYHLNRLVDAGYLWRMPGTARALVVMTFPEGLDAETHGQATGS